MTQIQTFTFSPFQENTYLLWDETNEAVIIDPGCLAQREKEILKNYISQQNLIVKALLQTHTHLDHVFGSAFVKRTYQVEMYMHPLELPILQDVEMRCKTWGIDGYEPVEHDKFLEHGDVFHFGNTKLDIVHVPGHSPGHIAFIQHEDRWIIGGDCLFRESVGRTDFPLCSHEDLMQSIRSQFFTLPDDYIVYAGHNEPTTIGHEKKHNPFLR
jgi:glyoxylase-like metal-dependent hydrolase (beta-lactamase superfamily II)